MYQYIYFPIYIFPKVGITFGWKDGELSQTVCEGGHYAPTSLYLQTAWSAISIQTDKEHMGPHTLLPTLEFLLTCITYQFAFGEEVDFAHGEIGKNLEAICWTCLIFYQTIIYKSLLKPKNTHTSGESVCTLDTFTDMMYGQSSELSRDL